MEHIKIEGKLGTWYEINRINYDGVTYIQYESTKWGDTIPAIILNEFGEIVVEESYNYILDDIQVELEGGY